MRILNYGALSPAVDPESLTRERRQPSFGVHCVREEGVDKTGAGEEQIPEKIIKLIEETRAAVPALIDALKNAPTKHVRSEVALVLGKIGGKEAVPALSNALKNDTARKVRSSAAEALGNLGGEAAVSALIDSLKDSKSNVRSSAAEALGKIGGEKAVSALIAVSNNDPDNYVRNIAKTALKRIQPDGQKAAL